jgi:UDP-glucuronate 4-epimerase
LANNLLSNNWKVIGLDAFTQYYDINLKKDRHKILNKNKEFYTYTGFIQDKNLLEELYKEHNPNVIIHLAAQAGVRYSIDNPGSYVESNLVGTFNILELARKYRPDHFLMASTSSVYGNNKKIPFYENQKSDSPISFYAATKKSNEVMAHSYSHLFKIPTTMIRFFTVYGPWGRPDMALFKFTQNILSGTPIDIYNYGKMKRDFTNIEDLVKAISLLVNTIPLNPEKRQYKINYDSISDTAPYRIVNIGSSKPIKLMDYISELEKALGIVAQKHFLEMQDGDVINTSSNTELLHSLTGFRATKTIEQGILEFVDWYKSYYKK